MSNFAAQKKRVLEKHRDDLIEEWTALTEELSRSLSPVDQIRLQRQVDERESQINALEEQLERLETPSVKPKARINAQDGAEMILIPSGEFIMGSTEAEIEALLKLNTVYKQEWFTREIPQHRVHLDANSILMLLANSSRRCCGPLSAEPGEGRLSCCSTGYLPYPGDQTIDVEGRSNGDIL